MWSVSPLPSLFASLPPDFAAYYDASAPWALLGEPLDESRHPNEAKRDFARRICDRFAGPGSGEAAEERFNRIHQDREINSLILTFGLGIILTNAILSIWAADIHSTSDPWFQDSMVIADTLFAMNAEVAAFVGGLVLMAGVWWWLNHSWQGRAVRALSSNRAAATLMGVNPRKIEILSFLIAALLATFAGFAIYTGKTVFPALGHVLTVKAFIITVLAGMGSIPGVLIGAIMIGVIESLTVTYLSASLQELAGMILFLVVLFVSPSGLFGGGRALAR